MPTHETPCEQVTKLAIEMVHVKEKLNNINGISESLAKLTTLMELQQQYTEKQNQVSEEQSKQLIRLGATVDKINDKIDRTDDRVATISKIVSDSCDKDKVDLRDIRNKVMWIAISIVATGAVVFLVKAIAPVI